MMSYALVHRLLAQGTSPRSAILGIAHCIFDPGIGIGDLQRSVEKLCTRWIGTIDAKPVCVSSISVSSGCTLHVARSLCKDRIFALRLLLVCLRDIGWNVTRELFEQELLIAAFRREHTFALYSAFEIARYIDLAYPVSAAWSLHEDRLVGPILADHAVLYHGSRVNEWLTGVLLASGI
jgi:hypothetical protein